MAMNKTPSRMTAYIKRLPNILSATLFLCLCVLIAYAWWAIETTVQQALPGKRMSVESLTLDPQTSVTLGRQALGQRRGPQSAESRHIRLAYVNHRWRIYNVAKYRRVLLRYGEYGELYLRRWEIQSGDQIKLGEHTFTAELMTEASSSPILQLKTADTQYHISVQRGASVFGNTTRWLTPADCDVRSGLGKLKDTLRDWRYDQSAERSILTFGGHVDCQDRIAVSGFRPRAFRLLYKQGTFFIAPGQQQRNAITFKRHNASAWQKFSDIGRPLFPTDEEGINGKPLGQVEWLILGKTYYRLSVSEKNALRLQAFKHQHYFFDDGDIPDDFEHRDQYSIQALIKARTQLPTSVRVRDHIQHQDDRQYATWLATHWHEPRLLLVIFCALCSGAMVLLMYYRRRQAYVKLNHTLNSPTKIFFVMLLVMMMVCIGAFFVLMRAELDQFPRSDLAILLIINWFGACLAVAMTPGRNVRLFLFWLLSSGVFMIGSLTLELLSQGATESHWLTYDYKHIISLSVTFLVVTGALLIDVDSWKSILIAVTHGQGYLNALRSIGISALPLVLFCVYLPGSGVAWTISLGLLLMFLLWFSIVITPPNSRAALLSLYPLIILILVFVAWLAVGREEGVDGFQPMELGKYVAILIFAIFAASLDYSRRYAAFLVNRFWWRLIALVAFYTALFLGVPIANNDFSPVLILVSLGLSLLVMTGAWLLAHRLVRNLARERCFQAPPEGMFKVADKWQWQTGIFMLLALLLFALYRVESIGVTLQTVILLVGLAAFFWAGPKQGKWLELWPMLLGIGGVLVINLWINATVEQVRDKDDLLLAATSIAQIQHYPTHEQRIAVWLHPERHPDLGSQLGQSLTLIGQTACQSWRLNDIDAIAALRDCHNHFGLNPQALMAMPAIQDDFIMTFLINRFGIGGALMLGVLQMLIVGLLLHSAMAQYIWQAGDYADDAARQVLCFVTFAGAGLLLLHWVISWGNAFGVMPIMGQPSTWISAANSHIGFMAIPILVGALILLRLPKRMRL